MVKTQVKTVKKQCLLGKSTCFFGVLFLCWMVKSAPSNSASGRDTKVKKTSTCCVVSVSTFSEMSLKFRDCSKSPDSALQRNCARDILNRSIWGPSDPGHAPRFESKSWASWGFNQQQWAFWSLLVWAENAIAVWLRYWHIPVSSFIEMKFPGHDTYHIHLLFCRESPIWEQSKMRFNVGDPWLMSPFKKKGHQCLAFRKSASNWRRPTQLTL